MSEDKTIKITFGEEGTIEVCGNDAFCTFFRNAMMFAIAKNLQQVAMVTAVVITSPAVENEFPETLDDSPTANSA